MASLVALLVAGCAVSFAGPDAPSEDERVLALLAADAAECRRWVRCVVDGDPLDEPDGCRPVEERRAEHRRFVAANPDTAVDEGALARCLAEAETDCSDGSSHLNPSWATWCWNVIVPRCEPGCAWNERCVRRERCGRAECAPLPGPGAECLRDECAAPGRCELLTCVECGPDDPCPDGSYCSDHACRRYAGSGEACGPTVCGPGLACRDGRCTATPPGTPCESGEECASYLCRGGACVDRVAEGEPCTTTGSLDAFGDCHLPLRCDGVRCRAPREGDGCAAGGRSSCGPAAPFCDPDTYRCTADATTQYCYPPCPSGFACDRGTAHCAPALRPGEPCGDGRSLCQGGRCVDGTCVGFVTTDAPCGPSALCPSGWSCREGSCVPDPTLGQPCVAECHRGACIAGTCTLRAVGAACSGTYECEGVCDEGRCGPVQREVGGACEDFRSCAEGLDCVDGRCEAHCSL